MRCLAFASFFCVCATHGRRKQASSHQFPGNTFQRKQDVDHADPLMQSFKGLLLALHPATSMTRHMPTQRSPLPSMSDGVNTKVKVKIKVPSKTEDAANESPKSSVQVKVKEQPSEGTADVNATSTDDATKIKVTVKKATKPPASADSGDTPLYLMEGLPEKEQKLVSGARGNVTALLEALQEGVNPNMVDSSGRTLLHYVVASGNSPILVILIHFGADMNVQDKAGLTPMHMAAGYMKPRSLGVLLAAGADPALIAPGQGTPLDIVVQIGEATLNQFMSRTGVDKMKKKDDKLEKLRACMDVFDKADEIIKEANWDDMVKEVLQVTGEMVTD